MPHIPRTEQVAIINRDLFPNQPGQLCWLFADWMLKYYNAAPSWTTIHMIRKLSRHPMQHRETSDIVREYGSAFSKEDVEVAAELAFMEFYRVVGAAHEDAKIRTNGDAFEGARVPNE